MNAKIIRGKELLHRALDLYSHAIDPSHMNSTNMWLYTSAPKDRMDRAEKINHGEAVSSNYWKTASASQVYQCASCHFSNNMERASFSLLQKN